MPCHRRLALTTMGMWIMRRPLHCSIKGDFLFHQILPGKLTRTKAQLNSYTINILRDLNHLAPQGAEPLSLRQLSNLFHHSNYGFTVARDLSSTSRKWGMKQYREGGREREITPLNSGVQADSILAAGGRLETVIPQGTPVVSLPESGPITFREREGERVLRVTGQTSTQSYTAAEPWSCYKSFSTRQGREHRLRHVLYHVDVPTGSQMVQLFILHQHCFVSNCRCPAIHTVYHRVISAHLS